jgi:quinohemoprotein amine dehydrogenase
MRLHLSRVASAAIIALGFTLHGTARAETPGEATASSVPTPLLSCVGCHIPDEDGALSRIRDQRKTAEGWEMTINRMRLIHGLTLSGQEIDIAPASMRELVKFLADNQGLAPSESAPYRYLLEQDLNRQEDFDPELAVMCGRCHSSARFALQRRTQAEWEKLVHFHLGQYPSTEYSLYGRDRDWMRLALNETVPALAESYPLDSDAWREWQATDKPALAGRWVMAGHMAGRGDLHAVMSVEGGESDSYSLVVEGEFADGSKLSGSGKAVVYTGYDWRAQLTFGDITMRQVLAADASGNAMTGRMYRRDQELQGIRLKAVREGGPAQIIAVSPSHIQVGGSQRLVISGVGLSGKVTLPAGLEVAAEEVRDENRIVLQVTASADAATGLGDVSVGSTTSPASLAVYDAVDQLAVEPAYAIARVGDNGGSTPKVNAAFRAVGIDFGADGTAGTDDDITLGYMDGVSWQVRPWDEVAEKMQDVSFAGTMDEHTGIFEPAVAGPNPQRVQGTNNAGNLQVVASLPQGDASVTGDGQLIVTVQRWNSPPLK